MRRAILYMVLLVLLAPATIKAQLVIPQDKLIHAAGSYIVTHAALSVIQSHTDLDPPKARRAAMLVGLLVGIGKEVYDIKHGSPQLGDLAADVIGIATFRIVLEF